MYLINVDTLKLETFYGEGDAIPPYAILSHTWGPEVSEPSFQDLHSMGGNIENLRAEVDRTKLLGCCKEAKEQAGVQYIWIDTCCIDKGNTVERDEAINSMFRWYQQANICFAYLVDVHEKDCATEFLNSSWFRRGWTLQELLAPVNLNFYDSQWGFLGPKLEWVDSIQATTGIPVEYLTQAVDFREASIAQRMSWAANRVTTRPEDIAYCLFGIFDIGIDLRYGEGGESAFLRLQRQILIEIQDDTILAWDYGAEHSREMPTAAGTWVGALATSPSAFQNCRNTAKRGFGTTDLKAVDSAGGNLPMTLVIQDTESGAFGLLDCGPAFGPDSDKVVAVPLQLSVLSNGTVPDQYVRPVGRRPILMPREEPTAASQSVYIKIKKPPLLSNRKYWIFVHSGNPIGLEVIDVYPRASWNQVTRLIQTSDEELDDYPTRTFIVRLRCTAKENESGDFISLLKFSMNDNQQASCTPHLMVSSRELAVDQKLADLVEYLPPDTMNKVSASNGSLNVKVHCSLQTSGQQRIFHVRWIALDEEVPGVTNLSEEASLFLLKGSLLDLIMVEADAVERAKSADKRLKETENALIKTRNQVQLLKERIESLSRDLGKVEMDEKQQEQAAVDLTKTMHSASSMANEARQTIHLKEQELRGIANRTTSDRSSTLAFDLAADRHLKLQPAFIPRSPLVEFSARGIDKAVELLLVGGADPSLEDPKEGLTPLCWAADEGRASTVQLLLTGRLQLSPNETPSPEASPSNEQQDFKPQGNTRTAFKLAKIDQVTKHGWTALSVAALKGHVRTCEVLLDLGADPNHPASRPLDSAVRSGNISMVELLLSRLARVSSDVVNVAVEHGSPAIVKRLVESAPSVEVSKSTISLATTCGHEDIARYLTEMKNKRLSTPVFISYLPPASAHDPPIVPPPDSDQLRRKGQVDSDSAASEATRDQGQKAAAPLASRDASRESNRSDEINSKPSSSSFWRLLKAGIAEISDPSKRERQEPQDREYKTGALPSQEYRKQLQSEGQKRLGRARREDIRTATVKRSRRYISTAPKEPYLRDEILGNC